MRALTQGDIPFHDYAARLVDVDIEGKRFSLARMAPWNDSNATIPAFVLALAFEGEVHGQTWEEVPFTVDPNQLEPFNITTMRLVGSTLFVGNGDFGYSATIASGSSIDLYQFTVDESMYDEFYNAEDPSVEAAIFERLVELAKRGAPTSYAVAASQNQLELL